MILNFKNKEISTHGPKGKVIETYSITDPFKDSECIIVETYLDITKGEVYFNINGQLLGKTFTHPSFMEGYTYLYK